MGALLSGQVIVWDEQLRPLVTAEVFYPSVFLALRQDGQALAVAGHIGPDLVVDLQTGSRLFVPFKRRWKYDTGLKQFAPSGLPETPWLGIDGYDVVLLDSALERRAVLPRSKAQGHMIDFEKKVSRLHEMDPRQGDRGGVWNLQLTANKQFAVALATKREGAPARLIRWDVPRRRRLGDVTLPRDLRAESFAVSSNGAFAVVTGWSTAHNGARFYRVELGQSTTRGRATDLGKGPSGADPALSPDDQTLLAVSFEGSALWSLTTNQRMAKGNTVGAAHGAVITRSHVVVDHKAGLRLLDRHTLAPAGRLGAPGREIRAALELADGSIAIVSGGQGSTLFRWSPDQPERLVTVGPAPYHFGTQAGRMVGLTGRGNCATAEVIHGRTSAPAVTPLWKVCTSDRLHVGLHGVQPRVAAVDFERGRVVVQDGPAFVFDGKTGQRTTLAGSAAYERLHSAMFSPSGRYLIAVVVPKSIVPQRVAVWEVSSGKLLHRLRVSDEFAGCPAVSRDERRVVAVWGRQIHLYDLASGRELKTDKLSSFAGLLRLDPGPGEFVVRTRVGRVRYDVDLTPVLSWDGWRMQPIGDGASLGFLAAGEQRLATLELTQDGHVVYTSTGSYAASGSPPDHLHWVESSTGRTTRLTRMAGKNDPAAVRRTLRRASPSAAR